MGGKDSPKGSIGIYVKSVFPTGQSLGVLQEGECKFLHPLVSLFHTLVFSGDEIFSVNGRSLSGLTHHEAISIFKEIKVGSVQVTMGRREVKKKLVKIEAENF